MATEPLHFARAPITEAIIGIQIAPLPETLLADLRRIGEQVRDSYPATTEISDVHVTSEIGAEAPHASARRDVIGVQFQSLDSRQVFQARLNGFSFHRLAPYETWDSFRREAVRLWQEYRMAAGPVSIQAFSVRYINRLEIPAGTRMEHFVRVYPEIPPELPQIMNNYLMRLELRLEGPGVLTMHQTLLPSNPGTASILLDNDFSYPGLGLTEGDIWQRIEMVHDEKNRVFLACITEEMRRRIS